MSRKELANLAEKYGITPEKVEAIRHYYSNLTEEQLILTDTEYIKLADSLFPVLSQLQRSIRTASHPETLMTLLHQVTEVLKRPVPVLVKMWGAIVLADVYQRAAATSNKRLLEEVISHVFASETPTVVTADTQYEPLFTVSAFAARWMEKNHNSTLEALFEQIGFSPDFNVETIVGLETIASILKDLIQANFIERRFRIIQIANRSQQEDQEPSMILDPYPDSLMHLNPDRVPQKRKLVEAVVTGKPTARRTHLVHEVPRSYLAVPFPTGQITTETEYGTRILQRKNYALVGIPNIHRESLTPHFDQFYHGSQLDITMLNDHRLMGVPFDGLAAWVATKVSRTAERKLKEYFKQLDADPQGPPQLAHEIQTRKNEISQYIFETVMEAAQYWIDQLDHDVCIRTVPYLKDAQLQEVQLSISILTQGLIDAYSLPTMIEERGQLDTLKNDVKTRLLRQVLLLVLRYKEEVQDFSEEDWQSYSSLELRDIESIRYYFKRYIFEQLSNQDKLELLFIYLSQHSGGILQPFEAMIERAKYPLRETYRNIPAFEFDETEVELIRQAIRHKRKDPAALLKEKLPLLLGEKLVELFRLNLDELEVRWETIRDREKYPEPEV